MSDPRAIEWPTLGLLALCYGTFIVSLWVLPTWLAIVVLAPAVTLHASLTHEVIHGHPFKNQTLNAALVFPALTLIIPYMRFRATHLAHHQDERLTDPYDDPESNYLDPDVWGGMSELARKVFRFNNTLLGRLLIGPLLSQIIWMKCEARAIRNKDRAVIVGWLLHIPAVAVVIALVWAAPLPVWAYVLGAYGGLSIQRIRTFLEHRAHDSARAHGDYRRLWTFGAAILEQQLARGAPHASACGMV